MTVKKLTMDYRLREPTFVNASNACFINNNNTLKYVYADKKFELDIKTISMYLYRILNFESNWAVNTINSPL